MSFTELLTMHEDYVRRVVPAERLFFFNVKDGWEPLCKILDCPVPDEPFPRANDKESMQEFFGTIMAASLVRWLQIFAVSGAAVAMGWYAWKQR
jgi:Sulfotransferase domain